MEFSGEFLGKIRGLVKDRTNNQDLTTVVTTFLCLLCALELQATPCEVEVKIHVPFTGGLGSSASVSCSLSAAFLALKSAINENKTGCKNWENGEKDAFLWDKDKALFANKLAFECERLAHGTPSGLDNTVVSMGFFLFFSIFNVF